VLKNGLFVLLMAVAIMIFAGCGLEHDVEEMPTELEASEALPASNEPPEAENEDKSISESNNEEEEFLTLAKHTVLNGWIYYANFYSPADLRKCRLDLSEDQAVFQTGFRNRFGLNADGECVQLDSAGPRNRWYIYDVHKFTSEETDLSLTSGQGVALLYRDNIFLGRNREEITEDMHVPLDIEMFDRKGNFVKTVTPEPVGSRDWGHEPYYALVDDALYYHVALNDDDAISGKSRIMRYDLNTETTEKVFEFDVMEQSGDEYFDMGGGEYFTPIISFDKRTIIVQNGLKSFVYTSIDDAQLKKVDLECVGISGAGAVYAFSMDGDLYFMSYVANPDKQDDYLGAYGCFEYYVLPKDADEPVFWRKFDVGETPIFAYDGYVYFSGRSVDIWEDMWREKVD